MSCRRCTSFSLCKLFFFLSCTIKSECYSCLIYIFPFGVHSWNNSSIFKIKCTEPARCCPALSDRLVPFLPFFSIYLFFHIGFFAYLLASLARKWDGLLFSLCFLNMAILNLGQAFISRVNVFMKSGAGERGVLWNYAVERHLLLSSGKLIAIDWSLILTLYRLLIRFFLFVDYEWLWIQMNKFILFFYLIYFNLCFYWFGWNVSNRIQLTTCCYKSHD